jgi:hypothetical protein
MFWFIELVHSLGTALSSISPELMQDTVKEVAIGMNVFDPLLYLFPEKFPLTFERSLAPFQQYYYHLRGLNLVLPLILSLGLLLKAPSNYKKLLLAFFIPLLFLLYCFVVNITPWGPKLFNSLIEHIPLWGMFRNFFSKFHMPYSFFYAICLGISLSIISSQFKRLGRILFLLASIILLVLSVPFLRGAVVNVTMDQPGRRTPFIKFPPFVQEISNYINQQEYSGVLLMPFLRGSAWGLYDWDHWWSGHNPFFLFLDRPVFNDLWGLEEAFTPTWALRNPLARDLNKAFKTNDHGLLKYILSIVPIKRILFIKDYSYDLLKQTGLQIKHQDNKTDIKNTIESISSKKIFDESDYCLTELSDVYPHIYKTSKMGIISSDINSLAPLMYSSFSESYPTFASMEYNHHGFLLFLKQLYLKPLNEKEETPFKSHLLLMNKNLDEFLIPLISKPNPTVKGRPFRSLPGLRPSTAGKDSADGTSGACTAVRINQEGRGSFNLDESRTYEIWIHCNKDCVEKIETIQIDDAALPVSNQSIDAQEFHKLAKRKLDKGDHLINLRLKEGFSFNDLMSEKSSDIEIIFIPTLVYKEALETFPKKMDLSYIFFDPSNQHMDQKGFLTAHARETYNFKLRLTPAFQPTQAHLGQRIIFDRPYLLYPLRSFAPSNIKTNHCTYSTALDQKGLNLNVEFDGGKDEDEYLSIERTFKSIDLEKKPYFLLTYQVEDSAVQTIQTVIVLETKKNSNKELTIDLGYPPKASTSPSTLLFNLYEKAKARFPDANNFFIKKIILYPHKIWNVDCSSPESKKTYLFTIRNFQLLDEPPPLLEENRFFKEPKLKDYVHTDTYYYVDDETIKRSKQWAEIPKEINTVYQPKISTGLDPNLFPFLFLNLDPLSKKNNKFLRIDLEFDTDEDGIPDTRMPKIIPLNFDKSGTASVLIPTLPLGKFSRITSLVYYENQKQWRYRASTLGWLLYEKQSLTPKDIQQPLLKIDNKALFSQGKEALEKEKSDWWVRIKSVPLKAGDHTFELPKNPKFNIDMIIVEPDHLKKFPLVPVQFERINPTRYIIDVKNDKAPFIIVFGETFHEDWKAYLFKPSHEIKSPMHKWKGSVLFNAWVNRKNLVEIKDHFKVNAHANGWYVSESLLEPDDFQLKHNEGHHIVLEFKPQRMFEIGVLISGTTLLFCFLFLISSIWRNRRLRKQEP